MENWKIVYEYAGPPLGVNQLYKDIINAQCQVIGLQPLSFHYEEKEICVAGKVILVSWIYMDSYGH